MWQQRNGWLIATALLLLTGFDCASSNRQALMQRQAFAASPTDLAPVAQALTTGPITLSLQYRALGPGTDREFLRSFWGFGTSDQADSDFTNAIDAGDDSLIYVRNSRMGAADGWCALRYRDKEPLAFYIDLNGDGALSDDEILKPQKNEDLGSEVWDFVTPDFQIPSADGPSNPYRCLIRVQYYGGDRPNCMWASLCVWESEIQIGDDAYVFTLMDGSLNGDFMEFGGGTYYSLTRKTDTSTGWNTQTLSSLFPVGDQYASLEFGERPASKDDSLQVVLTRDTTPQGSLVLDVAGLADEQAELQTMRIVGADDPTVVFQLQRSSQASLPALRYELQRANLTLSKDDQYWNMALSGDLAFTVSPDQPARISLGDPELAVTARLEQDRYRSDIQENLTTCAVGDVVYLSREVTGTAGERYGQVAISGREYQRIEPQVSIVNDDDDEIGAGTMEYG